MERLEDLIQPLVMLVEPFTHLALDLLQSVLEGRIGTGDAAQLNKCPHDLDVHSNRSIAAKDPGEHCDSLLSEDVRLVAAAAPPFF